MPEGDAFSRLYKSVGRNSRYAGLGFVALSILFLILAVSDQFIVFEVDSVVAFLAAVFLLFKDPSARVRVNVLDAVVASSDQAIAELATPLNSRFAYVEMGSGVEGVVVVPSDFAEATESNGSSTGAAQLVLTPPGRGLAVLYTREAGVTEVTMEAINASLSETMRERFGLARSVDIDSKEDGVKMTLHGASANCTCATGRGEVADGGSIGCTLASFLAVLVTTATGQQVSLQRCLHEPSLDTWTVSMSLAPSLR